MHANELRHAGVHLQVQRQQHLLAEGEEGALLQAFSRPSCPPHRRRQLIRVLLCPRVLWLLLLQQVPLADHGVHQLQQPTCVWTQS
jgi:hypothetical protein